MGKFSDQIMPQHREFIERQHLFFVSTAPRAENGHINLSPKGLDSFRVLDAHRVAYLDVIGSGNETAAHIIENGRITFMFCAFEGSPNILRLYGIGRVIRPGEEAWDAHAALFDVYPNVRQIITAHIHLVQTSCGFGVPLYDYTGERTIMAEWAAKKGPEGLQEYIREKNAVSLDGLPTGF